MDSHAGAWEPEKRIEDDVVMASLGDLVEIKGGGTPSRKTTEYWGGNIPWATVKDFKGLELSETLEKITKEGLTHSASNLIPAGSIILPTRMAVGKAAINLVDISINQDLKALKIKNPNKVDRDYLFRALLNKADFLERRGKGATVKGITLDVLNELEIPLPPMEEQKRIAAILDKADTLRRKRQKAIDLTDQLLRSVFLDMFGDPVTNPKGWTIGKIGDLLSHVNYGTSAKAGETGEYPILRMNNITYDGNWNLNSLKYIDMHEKDRKKYTAEKGDILFNRTNSKELVGKTAVFEENTPFIFAGYLVRGKVNNLANPYYISAYMNSVYGKTILQHMCKSIVGMANINAKEFQSIKIPIPPIEEQDKYSRLLEQAKKNISHYEKCMLDCDLLFNSLTQQAFRGELTKQNKAA